MEIISKSCILHMGCTTAQGDNEGIPLSMQTNSSRMVKAIRFCFRVVRGDRRVMGHALTALVALEELKPLQVSCLLAMLPPQHLLQDTSSPPDHSPNTKLSLTLSETRPKFLLLS